MKRNNWTIDETKALLEAYDTMLTLSKAGKLGRGQGKVSKAHFRNAFCGKYGRSQGSFEAKCMNISAVRSELGLEILQGYRPAGNAANDLRQLIGATL